MIDLSIISGTYNRLPLLTAMLESVRKGIPVGMSHEFVITDGGSTDGTLEYLRQQADVKLIEHGKLLGAIKAFCDAGDLAQGRYTIILNDDIEVMGDTILNALVYIEENPQCGGVCFADNRPAPGKPHGQFACAVHPYQRNGQEEYSPYIQCGMVRTFLGKAAGWWGASDPDFPSRTYAGDNYMSSRILEMGYTIDRVPGCMVLDKVADDNLRAINQGHPESGGHPDSEAYYKRYPRGATFPSVPTIANPDKRRTRILYLPILDRDFPEMKVQKRGLRQALGKAGYVYELDYLAEDRLEEKLNAVMDVFRPDILFTQIQSTRPLTAEILSRLRSRWPYLVVINWNGDVYQHGLTSDEILHVLRHVDLQLTVNASTLPVYEQAHIPAAYWQIGYERPIEPLPLVPKHDIVFLANNGGVRGLQRSAIADVLLATGANVGLYGVGWGDRGNGQTNYDFTVGAALYKNGRIAIGDNAFPDARGFASNRLFQALAAGGSLLLHQTVADLEALTGLKDGKHYIAWSDITDLSEKLAYWLNPANESKRKKIAKAGNEYTLKHHSFEARVLELFESIMPLAKRQPSRVQKLVYIGRLDVVGVQGTLTGRHYDFSRGVPTQVDTLDVPYILDRYGDSFTRVER